MLDAVANVYTASSSTGAFTVLHKQGLRCRLSTVSARGAASAPERAELVATRQLFWQADYVMPERCQVEVDGVRWNPIQGTAVAPTRGGIVVYRACDIVRA